MAATGKLDDAAPPFARSGNLPGAGVLLAAARMISGSIGPAFCGLPTTLVASVLLALLRIPRPESLKEHFPGGLGRIIGLDRVPEVRTLRRRFAWLATIKRTSARRSASFSPPGAA